MYTEKLLTNGDRGETEKERTPLKAESTRTNLKFALNWEGLIIELKHSTCFTNHFHLRGNRVCWHSELRRRAAASAFRAF